MYIPLLSARITNRGWRARLVAAFAVFACFTPFGAAGDSFGGVMHAALAEIPDAQKPAHDSDMTVMAGLLEQIQTDIQRKLASVTQIWCHQTIVRYSQTGDVARRVGRIEADVELADGVETYTSVRSGPKKYRTFRDAGGAWSSGEFGTILRASREIILSEPGAVTGIGTEGADEIDVLSFRHVSPRVVWVIEIGSRAYPISFEGKIRTSRRSGEIKRIQWRGTNLPPGMGLSGVEWSVNFEPVIMAGRQGAPPIQSDYTVVYRGEKTRVDRNVTLFSNFRRYGSDTVITYEPETGRTGSRENR